MEGMFLRVESINTLLTKAESVDALSTNMAKCFADLTNSMDNTKAYWLGSAADSYRMRINEHKTDIEDMLKRMKDYANKLRTISGTYRAEEGESKATAEALPDNVIS